MSVDNGALEKERRAGFICAFSAYTFWGVLPLYLKLVGFADPLEILGMRILWSVPAALTIVFAIGGPAQLTSAFRPRMLFTLGLSSIFIFGNWALYVWAVATDRIMEAALAYFLAPLVNVSFGVLFYGEKLGRARLAALVLAALGVVVQGVAIGGVPVLSIALCASWSIYSLIRKGADVSASSGLLVETLWLSPLAAGLLIWLGMHGPGIAFDDGIGQAALLALAGPFTAVSLILFAFGARRLPFSVLGFLQYLTPTLQFLLGLAFGEPFTFLRGVSFALIWAGLIVFSMDALQSRQPKHA